MFIATKHRVSMYIQDTLVRGANAYIPSDLCADDAGGCLYIVILGVR